MTSETFDASIQTQINHCLELLCFKGTEYAPSGDRLAAFKKAAALQGTTQAQAALGMLAKHLVSVTYMIQSGEQYSPEKWDEKIGDSINYLLIIRAIVIEENRYETH